jgi:signal transduction histidine kinase/ligand-binding sensor domain-containing protein
MARESVPSHPPPTHGIPRPSARKRRGLPGHSDPGWGRDLWPGLLWLALLAVLATALQAQDLAMRRFDDRDGLPQSQIWTLLEDRQGFVWAGTSDGLVRFGPNGSQLVNTSNGLRGKDITCLLEDQEGAIWMGTQERGLSRIQGRLIFSFGAAEGLQNEAVHCLAETRQGVLLAGTHGGLFRKRGDRFEQVLLPEPWLSSPISSLAVDSEDGVWLSSKKGTLARWDGSRLQEIPLPPEVASDPVLSVKMDPAGQLWVLLSGHLLRRPRSGEWSSEPLPDLPPVVSLTGFTLQPNGELILVLGSDGLYLRSPQGAHQFLNARSLPCRDSINCALRDRNGALWIGTNGDYLWTQPFPGLQSLVRHPDTGADLGLGAVVSFLELPGNRMLMGSSNGVFLWEEGKGLVQQWTRRGGLVSEDVWALFPDGQGGAWVGTMKGLHRLGPGGRLLPGPRELEKTHIQCMIQWEGRLWVGTDRGLAELDLDGHFRALYDPLAVAGYSAAHCLMTRGEDLLVGTSLGLLSFKNGGFRRAFPGSPANDLQILAMHQDATGRLWVGTSQRLLLREPDGSWKVSNLEAGSQPLYGINWIRGLATGTTAIGHSRGVTLVGPDGKALHLTRRMGLISDETNQGAALEDRQGRLWIGMVGGVCILNRLAAFPTLPDPTPVVLDVTWERGSFWLPKEATLPRGFTSLTVHVDAGCPNVPFPIRFETRLEDSGAPWHPLEPGLGGIYYGGLGYGTHRLHFRASLDGTTWRESDPVLLRIQPPWFLTLWAKGALVVLVVLSGLALVKHRFKLLERHNRELEAKVQARTRELEGRTQELALRNQAMEWIHRELRNTLESRMGMINTVSHDLRSPLTSILLSVERLREYAEGIDPRAQKFFGVLAHEAQRLEAIIKAVLDRNRSDSLADKLSLQPGHPREILEGLEGTLALKAEARGLKPRLSLDPASLDSDILFDPAAMQQVLFNLLENALKFTRAPGKVGVRSFLRDQEWILEVWDTGRGIPKHQCAKLFHPFKQGQEVDSKKGWGLGLYICRSIVEAHGGRIEVESVVAEGSVFRVALPLVQRTAAPSEATDLDAILYLQTGSTPILEPPDPRGAGA